jgi:2-phosphosulfolactate phosphatase
MTTNGTRAALNAKGSDVVVVTGMTNAQATVQFIKNKLSKLNKSDTPNIVFVASHPESDEDVACAEYMIALMRNPTTDAAPYISRIENAKAAQKFIDPENNDFLIEDLNFSARIEHSDYVMQVTFTDDESFITKRTIADDIS